MVVIALFSTTKYKDFVLYFFHPVLSVYSPKDGQGHGYNTYAQSVYQTGRLSYSLRKTKTNVNRPLRVRTPPKTIAALRAEKHHTSDKLYSIFRTAERWAGIFLAGFRTLWL